MALSVTLFFDVASPYCYIAHEILVRYQDLVGLDIRLIPVSLDHLFKIAGNNLPERACPNKKLYVESDLVSYAEFSQVKLHSSAEYKFNTRLAQALLVLLREKFPTNFQEYLSALWEAAQERGLDVSDHKVLVNVLEAAFANPPDAQKLISKTSTYLSLLDRNTQDAYRAGAYGLPYMTTQHHETGQSMGFFGCGRIEMALASLGLGYQGPVPTRAPIRAPIRPHARLQFAFDVLSPYAYFAYKIFKRYERIWALDIDYIPVHMPTLFQESGNHGPIYGCENKKIYTLKDLPLLAKHFNIALRIPDKFPCNTIPCQALLLIIKERCPSMFDHALELLWDATMSLNMRVEDPAVILAIVRPIFSPSIPLQDWVVEAYGPIATERIIVATKSLVARGAHGLPYFITQTSQNTHERHFFGSDRIDALAHHLHLPYHYTIHESASLGLMSSL
ncbi:Glutathione S-transferase kappa 1 [Entomophthora muscae]|uniref:Glutathione S-transferase kappa 1 n=1 Tax=Entomophthora muscae TaxID=34485 RepID=A0ACC2SZM7_9FUNG|nr:Glutathione S-transferase kappa 1 [Entomophthora muscae]